MSFLPTSTPAPTPKSKDAGRIAIFYAIILMGLATTQLLTFQSFVELLGTFSFPGGSSFAAFVGAFIVAAELFALPFLLQLPLSRAFRWLSVVAGWLAAASWLKISIWLLAVNDVTVQNVGLLGTVTNLVPGWWAVTIALAFVIMAIWASWGMWPGKRKK